MADISQEVVHRGIDNLGFLPLKLQLDRYILVTLKPAIFGASQVLCLPKRFVQFRSGRNTSMHTKVIKRTCNISKWPGGSIYNKGVYKLLQPKIWPKEHGLS